MAETHTKMPSACIWPAHILADYTHSQFIVLYQGVGKLGEQPAAAQTFLGYTSAKTAADAWVTTCGLTPG